MSNLERIPASRQEFSLAEMHGEFLLYSHKGMTTIYLNSSAAAIWQLCDGERSIGQIVDFLKSAYPTASARLEQDVSNTIRKLVDDELLTLD